MKNDFISYLGSEFADKGKINKQIGAYSIVFMIENLLRVSMHAVMESREGVYYFNETVFQPYQNKYSGQTVDINVVHSAKEKKDREKAYNLDMGYDYPYLWYLEYSTLVDLIQNLWDKYFNLMFSLRSYKKHDLIKQLRNISSIRNAIAHNRYISNFDLGTLQATLKLLSTCLERKFLSNFNSLVLNSAEDNINTISSIYGKIIALILKNRLIPNEIIADLSNLISAVVAQRNMHQLIKDIDLVRGLFDGYNKLPRKPGQGRIIEEYVKSNRLIDVFSDLVKSLGGII